MRDKADELAKHIGYKSANLLFLQELSIPIPPILPIANEVCIKHLNQYCGSEWQQLWERFKEQQAGNITELAPGTSEILKKLRTLIQQVFEEHPLPDDIFKRYIEHDLHSDDFLMVRSSGKEDSEENANPGGNKSFSKIKPNAKSISTAIGKVLASYVAEHSLEQRLKSGMSIVEDLFLPVLLQKMIMETSEHQIYSGVMYTSKAGTNIEVAPGHGELVVNSKGAFDHYYVTNTGSIHQAIYEKDFRYVSSTKDGEVIREENPKSLREASSLPPHVVLRLAELGNTIRINSDEKLCDIEFVYDSTTDELSIVQARQIPKPLLEKTKSPRAIAPTEIKSVKQVTKHEDKLLIACKTIVGNRAEEITNKQEILICKSITEALDIVLHQKTQEQIQQIKAIVIQKDAPVTSHEAAEFNSLSKIVIYITKEEALKIENIMTRSRDTLKLIIDPQRKLVIDWSGQVKEVFEDGLFKSTAIAERSILDDETYLLGNINEEALQNIITEVPANFESECDKRGLSSQDCLLDLLEDIEGVDASSTKILEARKAQGLILKAISRLSRPKPYDTESIRHRKRAMYLQSCGYILEINSCLNDISRQPSNTFYRAKLFHITNGLEALITNPGRRKLFSDSYYQIGFDAKSRNAILRNRVYKELYEKLPSHMKDMWIQLHRVGQVSANNELLNKWDEFIFKLIMQTKDTKNPEPLRKLTEIVRYAVASGASYALVNNLFYNDVSLDEIYINYKSSEIINIGFLSNTIDEWEIKIPLWSSEEQYEKLIEDFAQDIDSVIDKLNELRGLQNLPFFTKAHILKELSRFVEMIDISIKTMKGSPNYPDQIAKTLKFARMLGESNKLMSYLLRNTPTTKSSYSNSHIIGSISEKFNKHIAYVKSRDEDEDEDELSPSGYFLVNAATISSKACFYQSFEKIFGLTLEDYFTLFHQNSVESIALIGSEFYLSTNLMPPFLAKMHTELVKMRNMTITRSEITQDKIILHYNVPLNDHAFQLHLEFDKKTQQLSLIPRVFGVNRGGRVFKVAALLNAYVHFTNSFHQNYEHTSNPITLECDAKALSYEGEVLLNKDQGIMGKLEAQFEIDGHVFTEELEVFTRILRLICAKLDCYNRTDYLPPEFYDVINDIGVLLRPGQLDKKIKAAEARINPRWDFLSYFIKSMRENEAISNAVSINDPPIIALVIQGNIESIRHYIETQATENLKRDFINKDLYGNTAISTALWLGNFDIAEEFLPYITHSHLKNIFLEACKDNDDMAVKFLLNQQITPIKLDIFDISKIIRQNNLPIVKCIFDSTREQDILSILYIDRAIIEAIDTQDIEILRLVLPYVSDINVGYLARAVKLNQPRMIELILANPNIDINKSGQFHEAPLIIALENNLMEIANVLIEHGASLDVADKKGITARVYLSKSTNPGRDSVTTGGFSMFSNNESKVDDSLGITNNLSPKVK